MRRFGEAGGTWEFRRGRQKQIPHPQPRVRDDKLGRKRAAEAEERFLPTLPDRQAGGRRASPAARVRNDGVKDRIVRHDWKSCPDTRLGGSDYDCCAVEGGEKTPASDSFEAPRGCSGTHPVGEDETAVGYPSPANRLGMTERESKTPRSP